MASYIIVDPSCDIHLVKDPDFKDAGNNPLNNLELRLFEATANGSSSSSSPYSIARIPINSGTVGTNVFFEFFPTTQNIVTIDDNGIFTPQNAGEVLMQVRYLDGSSYHYNIIRIRVHDKMNGWWFGNDSLSVFRDPVLAHSQVSIYALFDGNTDGTGGIIGDITGHGYVALSFSGPNPGIVALSVIYRDRIQGLSVGTANIKGTLALPQHGFSSAPPTESTIAVQVIDFFGNFLDPNSSSNPSDLITSLKRVDVHPGDRDNKFNILFLSEGFTSAEEGRFDQAVRTVSQKLFEDELHAPFNLLKDDMNIWQAFSPSREKGITTCYDVGANGVAIHNDVSSASSNTNSYTLYKLIRLVGLPRPADFSKSNSTLRTEWDAAGSGPKLQGFVAANAADDIINTWKNLRPIGIPQTRDSFFGCAQSVRWGDRSSSKKSRSVMVTPVDMDKFAKRVYEWFDLPAPTRSLRTDPRRFALEVGRASNTYEFILNRVGRLADARENTSSKNHWVGRYWHINFNINAASTAKQIKSQGLICMLINHETYGGTKNNCYTNVSVSLKTMLSVSSDNSIRNIRPLRLNPSIVINHTKITNTLAHEFGHSFNLGDEYEEVGGVAPNTYQDYDNLASLHEIFNGASVVRNTATAPAPIDPDKVKWLKLHRTAVADELIAPSTVAGSDITVKLAAGKANRWRSLHEEAQNQSSSVTVFLRNLKAYSEFDTIIGTWERGYGKQLPLNDIDLMQLIIKDVPNDGSDTIVLQGAPTGAKPFAPGSVLYVAKMEVVTSGNPAVPATLVEHKVMQFMRNNNKPLSNNQNNDDDKCAPKSDNNDKPVGIPNFKGPCKSYNLIGVYEGGDTYTCEVYRPAGACKMRKTSMAFDYVCKYLIVNRVNASKLADLERYYPENKKG